MKSKIKKAQVTEKFMMQIPKLIMLILVFFIVIAIINVYRVDKLDVQQIESSLLLDRILYSRNCISYVNPDTTRSYPGIIDLNRFSSDNLESCLYYEDENRNNAAKLILEDLDGNSIKTVFYNKKWYENWYPLIGISGSGGTKLFSERNYVLIKEDDGLKKAKLITYTIIPNS